MDTGSNILDRADTEVTPWIQPRLRIFGIWTITAGGTGSGPDASVAFDRRPGT